MVHWATVVEIYGMLKWDCDWVGTFKCDFKRLEPLLNKRSLQPFKVHNQSKKNILSNFNMDNKQEGPKGPRSLT